MAAVNVSGGLRHEWQVRVNYATLAAYNLSVQQLSNALASTLQKGEARSMMTTMRCLCWRF